MITSRTVQNYLADCVSKQISPELQPAARQSLAEKQLTPLVFEAAMKQLTEDSISAAKSGAASDAKLLADISTMMGALEKRIVEKDSGEKTPDKISSAIGDVAEQVDDARNSLRTLEDKVDTLVPYQLWKVGAVACVALVIGAVASWNIRPIYKQWQWEQQQEGR